MRARTTEIIAESFFWKKKTAGEISGKIFEKTSEGHPRENSEQGFEEIPEGI